MSWRAGELKNLAGLTLLLLQAKWLWARVTNARQLEKLFEMCDVRWKSLMANAQCLTPN